MVLTSAGQELLFSVRHGLGLLAQAFGASPVPARAARLSISVLPAFAACWLVPRLRDFRTAHPDIDIDLRSSLDLADFKSDRIDAAIRYGQGGWPGVVSFKLSDETLFPVCSPSYLMQKNLREPGDLERCTLLHTPWQSWDIWLQAAGLTLPRTGPSYPDSLLLMQAAVAGEGVALGRSVLMRDEIAAGRLVRPFTLSVPNPNAYFLVQPPRTPKAAAITAFRDWMEAGMTIPIEGPDERA